MSFANYNTFATLFEEIYVSDIYSSFQATRPDLTLIDAGANIGMATLYFKRLHPNASVLAIEPDPVTFNFLQENIRQNHLKAVKTLNRALSNHAGLVSFFIARGNQGGLVNSLFRESLGDDRPEEVQVEGAMLSEYVTGPVDLLNESRVIG